ncbi:hypothetical protein [Microvirga massiliensis]|uniref:hypothetical protein n=1 Tax=Microvirga massiliensis TaxID=1033741 RepID=UPI00062B3274|nr:hypothetical protein [Microvirga massiliensis]
MIELTLTPAQHRACRNAISLALDLAECRFDAILRVEYAAESLDSAFSHETFGQRMNAAARIFSATHSAYAPNLKQGQILRAFRTIFETHLDGAPVRLDDDQAHALREALELLSRVHLGQFHFAIEGRAIRARPEGAELYHAWLNRCAGSLGIHNPKVSEEASITWDLYQVIRHHYA